MCGAIEYAVGTCGAPASIGINTDGQPGWGYTVLGHNVVAYGIYDDYSKIGIADPLNHPMNGKYYLKHTTLTKNVCHRIVY